MGGLTSVLRAGPEQIARSVKLETHAAQGTRRQGRAVEGVRETEIAGTIEPARWEWPAR